MDTLHYSRPFTGGALKVKRVTSSDDAEIEDNETVGNDNANENENGSGSSNTNQTNQTNGSESGSESGSGSGSSTGSETGGGDNGGGDDDVEGTGGDE